MSFICIYVFYSKTKWMLSNLSNEPNASVCFELLRSVPFYAFSQRMTARSPFPFLLLITVPLITPVCVREREIAWDIVFVWRQKNAVWLIAFGRLWCNVSAGRLSAQSWGAQYMQTHTQPVCLSFPATASACLSLLVSVFMERAEFSLWHKRQKEKWLWLFSVVFALYCMLTPFSNPNTHMA